MGEAIARRFSAGSGISVAGAVAGSTSALNLARPAASKHPNHSFTPFLFRMKKAFVILAALACTTAAPSFAQTRMAPVGATKTPAERAERQTQALTSQLGLSAEQEPKVESILQAQLTEMQALNEKYPAGNRRGMAPELKATKAKYDEQLKAVLTPEQFTKLEQLRQERRQQLRDRRKG